MAAGRRCGISRGRGGTIINIGSVVSDRAIPLQGMYSASKHAVLGYTDALRMELEHDRLPITVTLVKPASINTPFVEHARNYMPGAPTLPPPVYAPEVVARAILTMRGAADSRDHRRRRRPDDYRARPAGAAHDRCADGAHDVHRQQDQNRPAQPVDSLYRPTRDGEASGPYDGHVMQSSLYTQGR